MCVGTITEREATANNAGRVKTSALLKAGLIERRETELHLSDDARFSLGLA